MAVYIFRAVGVGMIKVGVSDDINRRQAEIAAMSPVAIEMVDFLDCASFQEEAWLHGMLRDFWSHGEWFREEGGLEQALRSFEIYRRASSTVAEMIAEHVPGEWFDAIKSNLYAAGAKNIADALTNITGESVMDRSAA